MRKNGLILSAFILALLPASVRSQAPNYFDNAKDYLKSDKSTDRSFALSTMGLIGKGAKSASKDIVSSLFDPSPAVQQAAKLALPNVNSEIAQPVLTLANKDLDYPDRKAALQQIGNLGNEGAPCLPALLNFVLNDAKPADRGTVIKTMAAVGTQDPDLTKDFISWAILSKDPNVRQAALQALPTMDGGKTALYSFIGTLNNDIKTNARLNAIAGIAALGKGNDEAIKALQNVIKFEKDPNLVSTAKQALEKIQKK